MRCIDPRAGRAGHAGLAGRLPPRRHAAPPPRPPRPGACPRALAAAPAPTAASRRPTERPTGGTRRTRHLRRLPRQHLQGQTAAAAVRHRGGRDRARRQGNVRDDAHAACAQPRARGDGARARHDPQGLAAAAPTRLGNRVRYADTWLVDKAASSARHADRRPAVAPRRGGRQNFGTMRPMFFNLPTLLTWARIVAIPLIVGLFYLQLEPGLQNLLATVLFVVVALTDWLDGYLARRLNAEPRRSAPSSTRWPTSSWSAPRCWCWCTSTACMRWWRWSSSAARSRSRRCANGWRRSAPRAASRCTWSARSRPSCRWSPFPFLLFDGRLFGVIDTHLWGTVLIVAAAVLTIWSMVYYLQKALPEIRAKAR